MKRAALLALGLVAAFATAAQADLGKKFKTVGDWTIHREMDAMTDKPSCTALYKDDPRVQLTADSLAFSPRGGVDGYQLRWDDQPAGGMQLPTDIEKQVGAFVLDGAAFSPVRSSQRVRVRALTLLGTSVDFDVSLVTAPQAIVALTGPGCV